MDDKRWADWSLSLYTTHLNAWIVASIAMVKKNNSGIVHPAMTSTAAMV